MAQKSTENADTPGRTGSGDTSKSELVAALGPIMDSASRAFPTAEDLDVRFSVILAEEAGKDELGSAMQDLPVVAVIAPEKSIEEPVLLLTDMPTASALIGLISTGEPAEKGAVSEDDLDTLAEAFAPLLDALSYSVERALGNPLGPTESIRLCDAAQREKILKSLPETVCRVSIAVNLGDERSGQIALILPPEVAEGIATVKSPLAGAEISEDEQAELEQEFAEFEPPDLRDDKGRAFAPSAAGGETAQPYWQEPAPAKAQNIDLILDIQLEVTARLGQVEMPIGEILKLGPGSVIDIDRLVDEPVELVVNDRLIARGEIVVVQENFGIRITEIISPKERIESLR
jgi:flagellar motor switch protein FliN/FliY